MVVGGMYDDMYRMVPKPCGCDLSAFLKEYPHGGAFCNFV